MHDSACHIDLARRPAGPARGDRLEMAATAASMLVELSAGRPLQQRRIEIATEFILRESTAPPRR